MRKTPIKKFIKKLSQIINNPQYSSWITWNTDGTKVIITDPQVFESEVIPKHFRLKKLSSFVRQLHLYDFHKIKARDFSLIFKNLNFVKDDPEAMLNIRRKRLTKAQQFQILKSKTDKISSQIIQNQQLGQKEQNLQQQKSVIQVKEFEQKLEQNFDRFFKDSFIINQFFDNVW